MTCFTTTLKGLPDGRYPDVLRLCMSHRGLFIGEAKGTEGPGDIRAQTRLSRYTLWWARAAVMGPSVLVIGCDCSAAGHWASLLSRLAADAGRPATANFQPLGEGTGLSWLDADGGHRPLDTHVLRFGPPLLMSDAL